MNDPNAHHDPYRAGVEPTANLVVTTEFASGITEVLAYGTAVALEKAS